MYISSLIFDGHEWAKQKNISMRISNWSLLCHCWIDIQPMPCYTPSRDEPCLGTAPMIRNYISTEANCLLEDHTASPCWSCPWAYIQWGWFTPQMLPGLSELSVPVSFQGPLRTWFLFPSPSLLFTFEKNVWISFRMWIPMFYWVQYYMYYRYFHTKTGEYGVIIFSSIYFIYSY